MSSNTTATTDLTPPTSEVTSKTTEAGQDDVGPVITAAEAEAARNAELHNMSPEQLIQFIQKTAYEKHQRKTNKRNDEINKEHKFWNTQPVPSLTDLCEESGPIDEIKTVADVKQDPYTMPAGFEWCTLDISSEEHVNEVYQLLNENYVEDDDNMFRFDYSIEFLRWALTVPGYHMDWHVGVRNETTKKLLAFITGTPAHVKVHDGNMAVAEINFLCVHKKLRHKRLAPVLIKEITRRVNLRDVWQAVYTAGVVLPKPVAQCRYYHRSLQPKKLVEVKFTSLGAKMTMAQLIKKYKLPEVTKAGLRPMTAEDIPSAFALLTAYLNTMGVSPILEQAEMAHMLLPKEGVVNSYVLTDAAGKVTDMCSFYHLPSTVIGNPKHSDLFAVYSFYNVATTIPLVELMNDSMIMAKNLGVDVFNALDLMDNKPLFDPLLFGIGDGQLQYYLYNWKCPTIEHNQVGLVLL